MIEVKNWMDSHPDGRVKMRSPKKPKTADHRPRVGIERRRRTRAHLLESALRVFAEKGLGASIDDVIVTAGVSRGTFYNYFRTPEELMSTLGETIANELVDLVEASVGHHEDAVLRVGEGLRLFLHTARAHPLLAAFLWRAGFGAAAATAPVRGYLTRHLEEGIAAGSLAVESPEIGVDVVVGIALAATYALSTRGVRADYPEQIVRQALRALGASARQADRIAARPVPELDLPPELLIARTR
jgi:AcrR family transcriptional regulator